MPRGESRLLVLDRGGGAVTHARIRDLPRFLRRGDLLVVNDTRVFPARLLGRRVPSGGAVECLLLTRDEPDGATSGTDNQVWSALVHPGQKLKVGARLRFEGSDRDGPVIHGEILERQFFGKRRIRLWTDANVGVDAAVDAIGHVPLPPYIHHAPIRRRTGNGIRRFLHPLGARWRLQPRACTSRSVALRVVGGGGRRPRERDVARRLRHVQARACRRCRAAHVSMPSRTRFRRPPPSHQHRARPWPSRDCRGDYNDARARGCGAPRQRERRIRSGEATVFIHPGVDSTSIDGLLTNFHLPKSSLLMLVSAFAGRERVLAAYRQAVAERYRFYSYGDAMLSSERSRSSRRRTGPASRDRRLPDHRDPQTHALRSRIPVRSRS